MGHAINLALTKAEADQLHSLVGTVLHSPHIWREQDGWDHELLMSVHDRLVTSLHSEDL